MLRGIGDSVGSKCDVDLDEWDSDLRSGAFGVDDFCEDFCGLKSDGVLWFLKARVNIFKLSILSVFSCVCTFRVTSKVPYKFWLFANGFRILLVLLVIEIDALSSWVWKKCEGRRLTSPHLISFKLVRDHRDGIRRQRAIHTTIVIVAWGRIMRRSFFWFEVFTAYRRWKASCRQVQSVSDWAWSRFRKEFN